jgi:hypothetical protein
MKTINNTGTRKRINVLLNVLKKSSNRCSKEYFAEILPNIMQGNHNIKSTKYFFKGKQV